MNPITTLSSLSDLAPMMCDLAPMLSDLAPMRGSDPVTRRASFTSLRRTVAAKGSGVR